MVSRLKDAGMILGRNLGKNVIAVALVYLMAINVAWAHCADGFHAVQTAASEVAGDAALPHHHSTTGADAVDHDGQCEQACLQAVQSTVEAASLTGGSRTQTIFLWADVSNDGLWPMEARAAPVFPSGQWPPPFPASLVALKILLLN